MHTSDRTNSQHAVTPLGSSSQRRARTIARPTALAHARQTHESSGSALVVGLLGYLGAMPVALLGAMALLSFGF